MTLSHINTLLRTANALFVLLGLLVCLQISTAWAHRQVGVSWWGFLRPDSLFRSRLYTPEGERMRHIALRLLAGWGALAGLILIGIAYRSILEHRLAAMGCVKVADLALADLDQSVDTLPRPRTVVLPPKMPTRSHTLRMVVDATGKIVPSSIETVGVTDSAYQRALLEVIAQWRFDPARLDSCAVPHRADLRLDARRSRR